MDGVTSPRSEASVKSTSSNAAASRRSPLETIEECSRDDPDWAALHHRQAWFLQVILVEAIKIEMPGTSVSDAFGFATGVSSLFLP